MSAVSLFKTFKGPHRFTGPHRVNGKDSSAAIKLLLQKRAREIHSRQQFETIVAAAKHPGAVRALLEPLLAPGLPCCLMAAQGQHTEGCPTTRKWDTPDGLPPYTYRHPPGSIGG